MKKFYIAPEIELNEVVDSAIMTTSDIENGGVGNGAEPQAKDFEGFDFSDDIFE